MVNISKTSKAAKTISYIFTNSKSSRPELFCKKDILWNFAKFTGNDLCQSLFFNKVPGLRPATLLKKSLWHRGFPVNVAKFLRTPFFTEYLRWLLRKFLYWATCFFFNKHMNFRYQARVWLIKNCKKAEIMLDMLISIF